MEYQVGDYVEVKPGDGYAGCYFRGTIKSLSNGLSMYPITVVVDDEYMYLDGNKFLDDQMDSRGECSICEKEIAGLVNGSKHKRIPTVFLEGVEL